MISSFVNLIPYGLLVGGLACMLVIGVKPSDHELCPSCGLRNQHKLWCPDR